MNVGIITPRYPPDVRGGGEISVQLLATQLASHKDVSAITVYSFGGISETQRNGVRICRLGQLPSPTELANVVAYRRLKKPTTEGHYDVLHAYNMDLHPAIGYLARKTGIPTISTLNSYTYVRNQEVKFERETLSRRIRNRTTLRILRRGFRYINLNICLSDALARIYEESTVPVRNLVTIPNMIDPSFDIPEMDNKSNNPQLLYIGGLSSRKGVSDLIKAMSHLPESYSLAIAGGGPLRTSLEATAVELNVNDRITFFGNLPYNEVRELYARSDVFVHPGRWPEPFGRTILEAMVANLPVVCTDIGAPPDIIPSNNPVCDPSNPVDLAKKIESGYANRNTLGSENYTHAIEKYTPDQVLPQILEAYDEITT